MLWRAALLKAKRPIRRTVRRFCRRACALVTLLAFLIGTVGVPIGGAESCGQGQAGCCGCKCCQAGKPCRCGCACCSRTGATKGKLPPCCAKRLAAAEKAAAAAKSKRGDTSPQVGGLCPCGKAPAKGYVVVTQPRLMSASVAVPEFEVGMFLVPAPSAHAPHEGSRPATPPPRLIGC